MRRTRRKIIYLRGHHLLVLSCYFKVGEKSFKDNHTEYGEEFIKNSLEIYQTIINHPKVRVKIIDNIDDICRACKRQNSILCRNAEIIAYDKVGASFFGLKIGKIYPAAIIMGKIKGAK